MKIILDTNVLIGVFDAKNALHEKAVELLRKHYHQQLLVPVIVMAEFLVAEGKTKQALQLCKELGVDVVPTTDQELERLQKIPVSLRKKLKATDSLILAHCLNEKAELLTLDVVLAKAYKKLHS